MLKNDNDAKAEQPVRIRWCVDEVKNATFQSQLILQNFADSAIEREFSESRDNIPENLAGVFQKAHGQVVLFRICKPRKILYL
jgi:hypothetical protein